MISVNDSRHGLRGSGFGEISLKLKEKFTSLVAQYVLREGLRGEKVGMRDHERFFVSSPIFVRCVSLFHHFVRCVTKPLCLIISSFQGSNDIYRYQSC